MLSQDLCFVGVGSNYDVIESVEELRDYPKSALWRQLVNQVESSLCREDRSRQALDQLQQLAAEQGASTQFLLKSVIRETIRLTMECLAEAKELMTCVTTPREPEEIQPRSPVLTPEEREAQADAQMVTALNHVLTPVSAKGNLRDRLRLPMSTPKADPALIHQQAIETYEQQMRFLCGRFHAQRKRVGLDLTQIHATTFIALHHLKALDNGDIHHLPEAVYLRGFLRRLEPCLDLPAGSLTDALPRPVPTAPARTAPRVNAPSNDVRTGFHSQYVAYLAYGALMAGGIYAIAQQGAPKSQLPPLRIDTPSPATVNHPRKVSSHQPVQLQLSQSIAEPEFVRSSAPESRTTG